MTRLAPRLFRTRAAVAALAPVRIPSSTRITVRPSTGIAGYRLRTRKTADANSSRARPFTWVSSSSLTPRMRTRGSFTTHVPSSAMAPRANPGRHGARSLQTTKTSMDAPKAFATSKANGTPPSGTPTTTGCRSAKCARARDNARPACLLSSSGNPSPLSPSVHVPSQGRGHTGS